MDESPSKFVKTFKDKLKDRISLVKQKSTDFLLNARTNNLKHEEKQDLQIYFDSFLPENHQENEIYQALANHATETKIKETSQQIRQRRKIEDDFFLGVVKETPHEVEMLKSKKKKKKRRSASAKSEDRSQTEDKKTALEYFDVEMDDQKMVTPTIISRLDFSDAESLLWNGKTHPVSNINSRRNLIEEGFHVGLKPKVKFMNVKGVLSQSEDKDEWFTSDGELIMEDNPLCDFKNEMRYNPLREPEFITEHVDPVFLTGNPNKMFIQQNDIFENVLELDFDNVKFKHHPLFSLEHILAQKLFVIYEKYVCNKEEKSLQLIQDELNSLRHKKNMVKQRLLEEHDNNEKKIYKDETLQKCIQEVSKVRKIHIEQVSNEKGLENNILKLWRNIRHIRKQLKFNSTCLLLEISKINTDLEQDRDNWEIMFDTEISDIVDEIKSKYFVAKSEYSKNIKKLKAQSNDPNDIPLKPLLHYDEIKIRKNFFNEMCEIFRQPGEPIVAFKLTRSLEVITQKPESLNEINRRADVVKTKYFMKITVDNKEVCKTVAIALNEDFILDFKESYSVRIPDGTSLIKLLIFEQNSKRLPILVGEITVTIPEQNIILSNEKIKKYCFKMSNKHNYSHYGIGTCSSISEVLNKKYTNITVHNLDIEDSLICEGVLHMKLGWALDLNKQIYNITSGNSNSNKRSSLKQKPTREIISKLFDSILDPNDPKNSFLFSFVHDFKGKNISTDKFYLKSLFDFNFTLEQYDDFKIHREENQDEETLSSKNKSQLSPYVASSSPGRSSRTPRESVLDNMSLVNKILDPIDLQRRTSIRYLQLVNEHLMLQNEVDNKEKQLSDIVTIFKYPGVRSVTVDFLRPKEPLFHQIKQRTISLKPQIDMVKEYTLKICILKAFQLPCRLENNQIDSNSSTDETGLKMSSLRPFIRVTCQGNSARTSTVIGNNPTWNEQLYLPVRNNPSSVIVFNLFDEIFEDLLTDDRLEQSTIHFQYTANWLASLKISLNNVFSQSQVEGTFLVYSPPEIIGYKQNLEERYAHSHAPFNGLKKDMHMKQRHGFFISMYLEIFPSFTEVNIIPRPLLESNEMEYMVKYLNSFAENYSNQFPERKINLLVLDTCGKYVCITRLFKPLMLPDFGECFRNHFASNVSNYDSESSKSSTPNRKKSLKTQDNDEIVSRSIKSHLSGAESRRYSKAVKEVFEMKSLDENLTDDGEKILSNKVQACARFVAMIPLFELDTFGNHIVALSGYQTLRLVCGSMLDHTILLMNYFLQLGIECWCISGHAIPRGLSTYVLVKENQYTNEIALREGIKNYARLPDFRNKNAWKYCIYDATFGIKYDIKEPFCPLQKIYSVCNNENIWVNIQVIERCSLTRFNLNDTSDWRPVFQKVISCPGPLPGLSTMGVDEVLYNYNVQDVQRLRDAVEDKIRAKIQKWRGHRRTIWNRHCSSILKNTLVHWEKWSLCSSSKPKISHKLQQLSLSYQMYGFPFNMTYTTMREIVASIKATQIHLDEHISAEFALGVEVFAYPNRVYSVWIYLASVIKKETSISIEK